jgi:hypothetical protein
MEAMASVGMQPHRGGDLVKIVSQYTFFEMWVKIPNICEQEHEQQLQ